MKHAFRTFLIAFALTPAALAQDGDKPKEAEAKKEGPTLGMSVIGNHEAPKALVLVPWKPSEPGKSPETSTKIDDSKSPIDKEAFIRMLRYYEIAKTASGRKQ